MIDSTNSNPMKSGKVFLIGSEGSDPKESAFQDRLQDYEDRPIKVRSQNNSISCVYPGEDSSKKPLSGTERSKSLNKKNHSGSNSTLKKSKESAKRLEMHKPNK